MFGAAQEDAERRPKYEHFLDEVRALGATDLELIVAWSQADLGAIEVTPHPSEGVDDDLLGWVMDEAASRNLRVSLMPVIDLENKHEGVTRAALKSADWEHWWWSYRRFIMHYARIAAANKAALFSVGNQLLSTESDEAHWRALIGDVRKVYSGKLTYTAHVERFDAITFWDALDVVSLGGSLGASSKDASLPRTCQALINRLRTWAMANNKRYLLAGVFCEEGRHNETKRNHESTTLDAGANLRMLIQQRAFFESFQADARLEGVFVPQSFALDGPLDQSPTLAGKPAREVLRHWFTKSRARTSAPGASPALAP